MHTFWTKLTKPFLALAPMYDVTDFVFRELISDIAKPDVLFTEFVNTDALCSKGKANILRDLNFNPKQRPIIAQIWGTNPDTFYKAAKLIRKLGFDGIDINMGCPERSVIKNGAGAALIKNPKLAQELIEAVRKGAGNIPLSIKTRIGYNTVVTEEWLTFLLTQELDAITVHGRTAVMKSNGQADWREIEKAVKLRDKLAPGTLIVGNGDVLSYEEALEKRKKYKVDGVMIGRGVFANPWIFDKKIGSSNHTKEEALELLLKHTRLYVEKWGTTKNFAVLKKFYKVYVRDFKGSSKLRQKLMKCNNYTEVETVIKDSGLY